MKNSNKNIPFMGRGTTPKIKFDFGYPNAKRVTVYFYGTESKKTICKHIPEGELKNINGHIEVNLTSAETSVFKHRERIMMSIKAQLDGGVIPYCPPMYTYMGEVIECFCNVCKQGG